MNETIKYKQLAGQNKYKVAYSKANTSEFLFFPIAIFLKTILDCRTNRTFGFARHTSRPITKLKEPFFANAILYSLSNSRDNGKNNFTK